MCFCHTLTTSLFLSIFQFWSQIKRKLRGTRILVCTSFDQLLIILRIFYQFPQLTLTLTTQKMKFSIKYFFSKCDPISSFLRIWSHLLKKSSMEKFIFCAVLGKAKVEIFIKVSYPPTILSTNRFLIVQFALINFFTTFLDPSWFYRGFYSIAICHSLFKPWSVFRDLNDFWSKFLVLRDLH